MQGGFLQDLPLFLKTTIGFDLSSLFAVVQALTDCSGCKAVGDLPRCEARLLVDGLEALGDACQPKVQSAQLGLDG